LVSYINNFLTFSIFFCFGAFFGGPLKVGGGGGVVEPPQPPLGTPLKLVCTAFYGTSISFMS